MPNSGEHWTESRRIKDQAAAHRSVSTAEVESQTSGDEDQLQPHWAERWHLHALFNRFNTHRCEDQTGASATDRARMHRHHVLLCHALQVHTVHAKASAEVNELLTARKRCLKLHFKHAFKISVKLILASRMARSCRVYGCHTCPCCHSQSTSSRSRPDWSKDRAKYIWAGRAAHNGITEVFSDKSHESNAEAAL